MLSLEERLKTILGEEQIRKDEPMSGHTTFRIGGPAAWFVMPASVSQLKEVLSLCREMGEPYYLLGNGSNLLAGDRGYRGVMISLSQGFSEIRAEGNCITAQAGVLLSRIAREACDRSLTGFEFAAGIPGTLGGAAVMNAGAYGGELKDVIRSVTVLTPDGEVFKKTPKELRMGYRTSCIPAENYVVLEAEILLEPGEREAVRTRMDELAFQRRSKQPLEYPSAGSTFKRPAGYFAGKLIDDAGLRGFSVGGAQVSEKHCGFVINRDRASAADVLELCRQVREIVKARFGVELEMEVKTIGDF